MSTNKAKFIGHSFHWGAGAFAVLLLLAGGVWLGLALSTRQAAPAVPPPARVDTLQPGAVAQMDSPLFQYESSQSWTVDALGADPHEPLDPWVEPSGVVSFDYVGDELALLLAVGNYWGYLYVTVDGEPANRLALVRGNASAGGDPAGYKTFYEPEKNMNGAPVARWVSVHRTESPGRELLGAEASDAGARHTARVEVWRSWGQVPLRGVAVDALPPPARPLWPGVLLFVLGLWSGAFALWKAEPLRARDLERWSDRNPLRLADAMVAWGQPWFGRYAVPWALGALLLIAVGAWLSLWPLCLLGVGLLAAVSIYRPALWWSALLFGLPMYFSVTLPLLPGRAIGLIDAGVLGGLVVTLLSVAFTAAAPPRRTAQKGRHGSGGFPSLVLLAAIVCWALVPTVAAEHFDVALREWRTVFLTAGIAAGLLMVTLRRSEQAAADRWLLLGAWLAGGALMALIGVGQYASDTMTIDAEGVRRVRGLYGSPNNLALYLERTLAVSLGLVLFLGKNEAHGRWRWLLGAGVLVQLLALLLTFSKGGIVLALPAMLAALAVAGLLVDRAHRPRRLFPVLAVIALVSAAALVPYLDTARFRDLLNFSGGTGFLRIQLWRSAWAMALDHPLLGVGPDNFLYAFRSRYILPAAWQEPNLNHPHNWPLDWWTRLGIPGLLLALLWFGYGLTRTVRNLRGGRNIAISAGVLAATVAALAHGLIDVSYALPDLMLVWAWLFVLVEQHDGAQSRKK